MPSIWRWLWLSGTRAGYCPHNMISWDFIDAALSIGGVGSWRISWRSEGSVREP